MSNLYSFAIGVGSKNSRGEWLEVFYPAPLLNPEQGLSDIVAVSLGLTSGEIEPSSEQLAALQSALKHNGSSGGGMLVAQFIALLQAESVPLPAAAGLFFSGAPTAANKSNYKWTTSESGYLTEPLLGVNWESLFGPPHSYFKGISRGSRLDSPGSYDDIMAKFPPTLLLNGGARDFSLSMVIVTHAQLVRLGVEADLHLWEAMGHGFNANPNLPESRESYNVIVKFFDRHLEE
ncbi:alpha/beta hydrolase [Porticoccaceae bacterium]|nr:alpha/beta hydrolase [Porticoccaceae bacterium]